MGQQGLECILGADDNDENIDLIIMFLTRQDRNEDPLTGCERARRKMRWMGREFLRKAGGEKKEE